VGRAPAPTAGKNGRRVCIAANTTWYVYNFRARLIRVLLDEGYSVCALSPTDEYVSKIRSLGADHVHLELDNAGTNAFREILSIARIAGVLGNIQPDLLLTYTPKVNIYMSLSARRMGIPVIANVSGLGRAFTAGGWMKFIARRLYKLAFSHPSTVFFQNQDDLIEFVGGKLVESSKAKRLPGSGVDVDRFQPNAMPSIRNAFVFLLAARMLWDKGIADFVAAARLVKLSFPTTEFQLLGFLDVDNPSAVPRSEIERWQAEGIVRYLGATDNIEAFYANADCVVLPSYYREGVPRSLLEAASSGIPIITTDMPGCRDTLDDGVNGLICRPRDPHDLATCMIRMLSLSPAERDAMGNAGRQKMIEEFDERIVIERVRQTVALLLSTATAPCDP
jgi:glycosyltransferase involved in cell wall biosynthesis